MKLLKQGAEAKLYITMALGMKAVLKVREPKAYREKSLDKKILAERLRMECSLLSRAKKAGVRTPLIFKIEPGRFAIATEFVDGDTMKERLARNPEEATGLCRAAGTEIAKLHSHGIIHGDLTTGNIIIQNDKSQGVNGNHDTRLVFLDFGLGGLSSKTEDRAVDLLAFKKMFMSTHFNCMEAWKSLEETYAGSYEGAAAALKQIPKIEARARYS
ncbi:KEOPS complex subunit Bud32 [uncultured archaeon]|nr:KEOPS complex subunit Bud32 [uncultured archaeon]